MFRPYIKKSLIQETAHKKYISERREEAKLKRKEEKEAADAQKMKEW